MTTRQRDGATADTLHAAWHEASKELPPAEIDAAILAAARAAVIGDDPIKASLPVHRPWYQAWQPLLAAAGVAGLAFVLVQSLPHDSPSRDNVHAPVVASPSSIVSEPVAPADDAMPTTSLDQREERGSERAPETRVPQAKAAVPAPPAAMRPAASEPVTAQPAQVEGAAAAAAADAAVPAPAPAAAATAAGAREDSAHGSLGALGGSALTMKSASIATSVQQIVDLHARGDLESAADVLRKLRAQTDHADERLPESLRAWARTVQ